MNLSPSPSHRARACALIVRDGFVLVVRDTDGERSYWTPPGGGVHDGESPAETARREAYEEAGAVVDVGERLFEHSFAGGVTEYGYAATLVRLVASPEGRPTLWLEPQSAEVQGDDKLRELLERAGLFG